MESRGHRRRGRRAILLALAAGLAGISTGAWDMEDDLIGVWLTVVDRAAAGDWVALPDFDALPPRVRGDSSMWSERFFTPAASPAAQAHAVRGFHRATALTPDLLRHEYPLGALRLDVVESINFFVVRVDGTPAILQVPVAERPDRVRAAAAAILRLDADNHHWVFRLPAVLSEGSRFDTDEAADPLYLPSWESRVDGGIHDGRLYFVCYKKFFERASFRDGDRWFDGNARDSREDVATPRR